MWVSLQTHVLFGPFSVYLEESWSWELITRNEFSYPEKGCFGELLAQIPSGLQTRGALGWKTPHVGLNAYHTSKALPDLAVPATSRLKHYAVITHNAYKKQRVAFLASVNDLLVEVRWTVGDLINQVISHIKNYLVLFLHQKSPWLSMNDM